MFADFHTHILPEIDDGSKDVKTSVKMVNILYNQGVRIIFLTPHYYADFCSVEDFNKKRNAAFNKIKPYVCDMDIRFVLASEAYLTNELLTKEDFTPLCIANTPYMLTELPYNEHPDEQYEKVKRLMSKFSVIPILAHIDRFPEVFHNHTEFKKFQKLGCLFQANTKAFSQSFITRKILEKHIANRSIDFIGTDCHNLTTRPPDYLKAAEIIQKSCPEAYNDIVFNNALAILNKQRAQKLFI